jgi:hypothetical protein
VARAQEILADVPHEVQVAAEHRDGAFELGDEPPTSPEAPTTSALRSAVIPRRAESGP